MIDELDWYGPETATFGDRLSAAIEKSGMTQKLVAKRLGIKFTQTTVNRSRTSRRDRSA